MNPLITKYLTFLFLLTIHKYYVSSTLIDYSTNTETHQLSLKIFHDDLEKDLGFDTNELDYSDYANTNLIIKNYLKISCSIDNAPSTLNKFFKKNKLNLFISDDYFPVVKTINRKIKINFSSNINRSLEYYSGMVFNITVNKKGKKFSLISGGRYDGLLKNLGSKKNTTAVGAAIDMSLL